MIDMTGATLNKWHQPEPSPRFVAKHPAADVDTWRDMRQRVVDLAALQGWSKAETGRRIGMPESTFSQWLSGTLEGILENANNPVAKWLEAVEENAGIASGLPSSPAFFRTKAAIEIHATLQLAQVISGFVTVTLEAGRGKTEACRAYRDSRPHVHMVTLNPKVKTVHGAMNLLSRKLGIRVFNQAELVETIGERLSRGGEGALLIIDEAQHADAESINQFRYFSDNFKVGVAIIGNAEIRRRMSQGGANSASRDQIVSRVDKNLKRDPGRTEDVRAFIEAWGITEPSSVKFLTGIGMKGGALRQIDRTIKIAHLLVQGTNEQLEKRHLEAAWKNRDVEDL